MARKKLTKLSDMHLAAIRLKIEGHSCRQIAENLEVELRTVYLWFSDPLVKAEHENQRKQIFDVFAGRMADVGLRAITLLEETAELALDSETLTVDQRIELVREILDRIPLTAKLGNVVNGGGNGNGGPPPDIDDSELVERLRRVAQAVLPPGEVVDAEVVK